MKQNLRLLKLKLKLANEVLEQCTKQHLFDVKKKLEIAYLVLEIRELETGVKTA